MRYQFRQGLKEWVQDFWYDVLFPFLVAAGLLFLLILIVGSGVAWNEQNLAERGRYYLTACQLMEKNRDTGFWSGRENILQCGVTREHVNSDAYEKAIRAWQQKQTETE